MDDLILPDGRPSKPRRRIPHHDRFALRIDVVVDGGIELVNDKEVVELGRGRWMIVAAEAWIRLMELAMQQQSAIAAETDDERTARRRRQAKDRKN